MRLWLYFSYILVVWAFDSLGFQLDDDTHTEYDLHRRLFQQYNTNIIPRSMTSSDPLHVGIELYLMSVDGINEFRQTIAITAYLEVKWTDSFLVWEPVEYSNITTINVKVKDIWTPDIVLRTTLDKMTDLIDEDGHAVISSDGSVIMWPYGRHIVPCQIFIERFPFDEQTCVFDFLSWTNPSSKLALRGVLTEKNNGEYFENGEWTLKGVKVKNKLGISTWDHVYYTLELQRKSLYFGMYIMLPIICIAFLNTFCFILPSDGGERITFCFSILVTLSVFMTLVNGSLPESSDEVLKFGVYICLQLIGCGLSTMATVLSLYCFQESDHTPVRSCVQLFVMTMCLRKRNQIHQHPADNEIQVNRNEGEIITAAIDTIDNSGKRDKCRSNGNGTIHHLPPVTWKMVSCALDRFCFIASLVWHVVLLSVLLAVLVP
ncbi:hypothetical protein DPMN_125968 [Dreissena polymorpha]|uniref:Uncharacterized protein n=1 Tax=Dreissena polymorpha TaxID=45954 RepID=A0A9D4GVA6_DREPO|nr:hypothetical protein DPMN_125968 [Dreissena polymorpha]